jgi:phosphoenolpyruvate-protein kinase (PTS system EI component)
MHPAQLPAIKQQILRSSVPEIEAGAAKILKTDDPAKARALLSRLNA